MCGGKSGRQEVLQSGGRFCLRYVWYLRGNDDVCTLHRRILLNNSKYPIRCNFSSIIIMFNIISVFRIQSMQSQLTAAGTHGDRGRSAAVRAGHRSARSAHEPAQIPLRPTAAPRATASACRRPPIVCSVPVSLLCIQGFWWGGLLHRFNR